MFPLFRTVNSVISSDSIEFENELFIYIGNLAIILSEIFLMMGCLVFVQRKVNRVFVVLAIILFFLTCVYQFLNNATLIERTQAVVLFDFPIILISIYALLKLKNIHYNLERNFTIFWISFQFFIFIYWLVINFEFNNPDYGLWIMLSLSFVYVSHIFIIVGLITLTTAEKRSQLISQSINYKKLGRELEGTTFWIDIPFVYSYS
jgi:hypothetical protein